MKPISDENMPLSGNESGSENAWWKPVNVNKKQNLNA